MAAAHVRESLSLSLCCQLQATSKTKKETTNGFPSEGRFEVADEKSISQPASPLVPARRIRGVVGEPGSQEAYRRGPRLDLDSREPRKA